MNDVFWNKMSLEALGDYPACVRERQREDKEEEEGEGERYFSQFCSFKKTISAALTWVIHECV